MFKVNYSDNVRHGLQHWNTAEHNRNLLQYCLANQVISNSF